MSEGRDRESDGRPAAAPSAPRHRALTFAAQELRLISALVLLLAIGLFLALPFVLSIGAVVFLPLVTAIILTIVLSPLADRLSQAGLPNILASLASLIVFLAILVLALTAVFRPAVGLFDEMPAMLARIGQHFSALRDAACCSAASTSAPASRPRAWSATFRTGSRPTSSRSG